MKQSHNPVTEKEVEQLSSTRRGMKIFATIAMSAFMGFAMIGIPTLLSAGVPATDILIIFAIVAAFSLLSHTLSTTFTIKSKESSAHLKGSSQLPNEEKSPGLTNQKQATKPIYMALGKAGKAIGIISVFAMAGALALGGASLLGSVTGISATTAGIAVSALFATVFTFMLVQTVIKASLQKSQIEPQADGLKTEANKPKPAISPKSIIKMVVFGALAALSFAHTFAESSTTMATGITMAALVISYALFKVISNLITFVEKNKQKSNTDISIPRPHDETKSTKLDHSIEELYQHDTESAHRVFVQEERMLKDNFDLSDGPHGP